MAKFNDRLKQLRQEAGLSQMEFSKQLKLYMNDLKGCSKSSINMYERGEREPGIETLEAMADYFNVDMDYLIGKSDHKSRCAWLNSFDPENILNIPGIMPLPKTYTVPLLGNIACGDPILAEQNIADWVPVPDSVKNADFALTCQGDSMINARIFDGDIVYIRQQSDVDDGEIAAVLIGEEATLKRVYKMPGRLQLRAENPSFPPINLEGEDLENVRILGKAVAFTSAVR